jgi:Do/DeqQ family serine protease
MKKVGLLFVTSVLSALLAVFLYRLVERLREIIVCEASPVRYTPSKAYRTPPASTGLPSATSPALAPTDFIEAAEAVTSAVVNIRTKQNSGVFNFWESGQFGASSGSGVIVSPDGYIVTNNHVVEDGDEIEVTLNDKREFPARLIGTDPSTDLALLQIEAEALPYLEFGDSDSLRIGEWVLAVGNPFNLESTVTAGIVSAKGRSIDILEGQDRIESFIQTDAAVNPGNSGGALVNTKGLLIGINTAIITRSGRYEGYSFAIPANLVQKVINDLRDFGAVQRGLLGVFIDDMTSERAKKLGLEAVEGIYITRITAGSGADDAGLQKGDVIMGINEVKTKTVPEMQEQVGRYRPGDEITITYIREGETYQASVMLKNKMNSTALIAAPDESQLEELGLELRDLSPEERKRFGLEGVRVTSILRRSTIGQTNMEPGYIITRVDGEAVSNLDELLRKLRLARGMVRLEGFYEGYPSEYYYEFELE